MDRNGPKPAETLGNLLSLALAAVLLATAAGCQSGPLRTEEAAALAELTYPANAERAEDQDVLVRRHRSHVQVVNRTARTLPAMQLWLNQQYVTQSPAIAPGEQVSLDLRGFVNRYQEPFPIAGLLRPDRARPLLAAEFYDPAQELRQPVVVMPTEEHRRGPRGRGAGQQLQSQPQPGP